MGVSNMENALTVDHDKTRGGQTMDADLKFCQLALARGNSLAIQGQLESATRDLRAAEDAANAVKKVLVNVEGNQFLDRWSRQLAEVQRGLSDLGSRLDIPPERKLTYYPGRIEQNGGA